MDGDGEPKDRPIIGGEMTSSILEGERGFVRNTAQAMIWLGERSRKTGEERMEKKGKNQNETGTGTEKERSQKGIEERRSEDGKRPGRGQVRERSGGGDWRDRLMKRMNLAGPVLLTISILRPSARQRDRSESARDCPLRARSTSQYRTAQEA